MEPEENDKCLSGSLGLCLSLPHLGEARPQNSRPEMSPASHDLEDVAEGVEGRREEELDSFRVLKLGCCHLPSPTALQPLCSWEAAAWGRSPFLCKAFPLPLLCLSNPSFLPSFPHFPPSPSSFRIFSPLPHFAPPRSPSAPGDSRG